MDTLDELNAAIEGLCAIAERARERTLDSLIRSGIGDGYTPAEEITVARADCAALAMQYAEWTRSLDGYRALLRPQQPGVRVVR